MVNEKEKRNKQRLVIVFNLGLDDPKETDIAQFENVFQRAKNDKQCCISDLKNLNLDCIETEPKFSNNEVVKVVEEKLQNYSVAPPERKTFSYVSRTFYFRVIVNENNKNSVITDLILPFVLLRNKYAGKEGVSFILLVIDKSPGTSKNYHRLSQDLIVESLKAQESLLLKDTGEFKDGNTVYEQIFYQRAENQPQNLQRFGKFGYLRARIPWLSLNHVTYGILSDNVQSLFTEYSGITKDESRGNFFDDFYQDLSKLNLNPSLTDQNQIRQYRELLYRTNIKRTCISFESDILNEFARNKPAHIKHALNRLFEDLYEKLYENSKNLSILSFLFALTFLKSQLANKGSSQDFIIDDRQAGAYSLISKSHLLSLIKKSQDFASGVLQLIENAVEYADGNAVLWFRIRKSDALKEEFGETNLHDATDFLEVRIIDFSGTTIPETFRENLKLRNLEGLFESCTLSVKDFFQPEEEIKNEWRKYYESFENINHHFGLNQFLTSVSSGSGIFQVVSSPKVMPDEEEIFSWPIENELKRKWKHLSGTEYLILLPLSVENRYGEQASSGTGLIPDYKDEILKRSVIYVNYPELVKDLVDPGSPLSQQQKVDQVNTLCKKIQTVEAENNLLGSGPSIMCFTFSNESEQRLDRQYITDIFTKALLKFLHTDYEHSSTYGRRIAIVNASRSFVMNFTIGFATYCQKTDDIPSIKEKIKGSQVYICDNSPDLELYFVDGKLETTYKCNEFFFSKKGVSPDTHNLIRIMLESQLKIDPNEQYKVAPFDIKVKTDKNSPMTIFEQKTKIELERDIQQVPFGCTLTSAHVRVGSKIHVADKFYDSTLILASEYYTSRFAYLLALKIQAIIPDTAKVITIIGYESYSEILVAELKKILINCLGYSSVNYVIYQQDLSNLFKYETRLNESQNIVIIVPTNSTLSTHDKVTAALRAYYQKHQISAPQESVINFALVLIRDSNTKEVNGLTVTENKYWSQIVIDQRCVKTNFSETISESSSPESTEKNNNNRGQGSINVHYLILLESDWQDPLQCKSCFPATKITSEKPMLEVSKTSVMSMTMAGLNEFKILRDREKLPAAPGRIENLQNSLIYQHLEDSGNHYLYYFKTEDVVQDLLISSESDSSGNNPYTKWKVETKRKIDEERNQLKKKSMVFDVVVAPMNSTNGTFVQDIVSEIFDDSTFVIYLDPSREFRENMKAKFSHLTSLYQNNLDLARKFTINFHYINDTITSGNTIRRTQSLLRSLFPTIAFSRRRESAQVNIFADVIILLNRCSVSTRADFVSPTKFYRFFDVDISSIRNNRENACVLCRDQIDYQTIISSCSTNEVAKEWYEKAKSNRVKTFQEYTEDEDKKTITDESKKRHDRHNKRLICSDKFSKKLADIDTEININDPSEVRRILIELFKEQIAKIKSRDNLSEEDQIRCVNEAVEYIISYLKVTTRPFLVFRKSTLDSIFRLCLEFTELFISGNYDTNDLEYLSRFVNLLKTKALWGEEQQTSLFNNQNSKPTTLSDPDDKLNKLSQNLFKCLISRLSALGAKYLIRKVNIEKIRKCAETIGLDQKEFDLFYLAQIKRMITLNKDESIEYWLEYLLLTGNEYDPEKEYTACLDATFRSKDVFYHRLFLENSHIIRDAIQELDKKTPKSAKREDKDDRKRIVNNVLHLYFLDNFNRLWELHDKLGLTTVNKNNDSEYFSANNSLDEIVNLIDFLETLSHPQKEDQNILAIDKYYKDLAGKIRRITGCTAIRLTAILPDSSKGNSSISEKRYIIWEDQENGTGKIKNDFSTNTCGNIGDSICYRINDDRSSEWRITLRLESQIQFNIDLTWKSDSTETGDGNLAFVKQLRSVRNVLAFRYDFFQRLNLDFSNRAYLQYLDQRKYTGELSNLKIASHTPDPERVSVCETVIKVCDSSSNELDESSKRLFALALQLASDSLISQLNLQMVKNHYETLSQSEDSISQDGEDAIVTLERPPLFNVEFELNDNLLGILNQITCELQDGQANIDIKLVNFIDRKVRYVAEQHKAHYFFLFLVAICHNAIKHGQTAKRANGDDTTLFVPVTITKYDDAITVSNPKAFRKRGTYNNSSKSFSLRAIEYYFNKFATEFGKENNTGTFSFDSPEKNDGQPYIVKLPIVKKSTASREGEN